jgi:hypothetical protein
MKCEEATEEPATESTEKFYQLSCFIEKGKMADMSTFDYCFNFLYL